MIKFQFWKNDTEDQRNRILDNFHSEFSELIKFKDITIIIKETRKSPSDNQRGYIFGYLVKECNKAMRELGNEFTDEECYLFLKDRGKFFKVKEIRIKDKKVSQKIYETFSNSGDQKRVSEFIDWLIRWAAEYLSICLESPEDYKLKRGMR